MNTETTSTRSDSLTQGQLAGVVNDLLTVCDPILQKHGIRDRDGAMMQMMLLSYTVGSIIGAGCDAFQREQVILAALANIRKGAAMAAGSAWLSTMECATGAVH